MAAGEIGPLRCLVLSVECGFSKFGVTVWDVGASPLALIFFAENHPLESILFSVLMTL